MSQTNRSWLLICLAIGLVIGFGSSYLNSRNIIQELVSDNEVLSHNLNQTNEKLLNLTKITEDLIEENEFFENVISNQNNQITELKAEIEDLKAEIDLIDRDREFKEKGGKIQIAVILHNTVDIKVLDRFFSLVEDELKAYCQSLGKDITFEFLMDISDNQPGILLEKLQSFKSMSIDFVIGGVTEVDCETSLDFINNNDMIMISPYSSSPSLSIVRDGLFRMVSPDQNAIPALSDTIWDYGLEVLFVIKNDDFYTDEKFNRFTTEFEADGGTLVFPPSYLCETRECYLEWVEEMVGSLTDRYDKERIGFLVMGYSFGNMYDWVTLVKEYESIVDLTWFGLEDSFTMTKQKDAFVFNDVELFLFYPHPEQYPINEVFHEKYDALYYNRVGKDMPNLMVYWYDSIWILVKAIINTNSLNPATVQEYLVPLSLDYYGASGLCTMDTTGDRLTNDYGVYGYRSNDVGELQEINFGVYDTEHNRNTWFTERLGYIPPGH